MSGVTTDSHRDIASQVRAILQLARIESDTETLLADGDNGTAFQWILPIAQPADAGLSAGSVLRGCPGSTVSITLYGDSLEIAAGGAVAVLETQDAQGDTRSWAEMVRVHVEALLGHSLRLKLLKYPFLRRCVGAICFQLPAGDAWNGNLAALLFGRELVIRNWHRGLSGHSVQAQPREARSTSSPSA